VYQGEAHPVDEFFSSISQLEITKIAERLKIEKPEKPKPDVDHCPGQGR
jgi:hypothetical protein